MRYHSNQWHCSYFLLCLAFSRHYLKTGKSTLKVYIFWEGHKNLKKTRLILTESGRFFSNFATFSQFMNFNMQYGLSCIQRFPEIMIHHNVLRPLETSMFNPWAREYHYFRTGGTYGDSWEFPFWPKLLCTVLALLLWHRLLKSYCSQPTLKPFRRACYF